MSARALAMAALCASCAASERPERVVRAPIAARMSAPRAPSSFGRAVPLVIFAGSPAVRGVIEPTDPSSDGGSHYDEYHIAMGPGEAVTILARGGASTQSAGQSFDVVAQLNFEGHEVAENDDIDLAAGIRDSRILYTARRAGDYVLRIRSYGRDFGPYEVEVRRGLDPLAR